MGLFTFIKSLFAKATQLETQVESFVSDVAKVAPDTATNLRSDLNKVKKVKKEVEAKTDAVEAWVKKETPKKPKTTTAKKTTK